MRWSRILSTETVTVYVLKSRVVVGWLSGVYIYFLYVLIFLVYSEVIFIVIKLGSKCHGVACAMSPRLSSVLFLLTE